MRATRLLLAVTLVLALTVPAAAQTIIAQHDYAGASWYYGVSLGPDYVVAQTFVATTTATVGSIDATVQKWGATDVSISFEIRSVWDSGINGWQPDFSEAGLLSSGAVSADDPQWNDWSDQWLNVPMTPYELQAGQRYAIVASAAGLQTWSTYVWLIGADLGYADGTELEGYPASGVLAQQDRDTPFRVNGTTEIPVDVDVLPSDDPNEVSLKSKGVLPVAVLSSADFDAATLDPTTIRLGDPELSGVAQPVRCSWEDVDLDGRIDLVLKFSMPTLVANGAIDADSLELSLTGETTDGGAVAGSDAVVVVH